MQDFLQKHLEVGDRMTAGLLFCKLKVGNSHIIEDDTIPIIDKSLPLLTIPKEGFELTDPFYKFLIVPEGLGKTKTQPLIKNFYDCFAKLKVNKFKSIRIFVESKLIGTSSDFTMVCTIALK